eukprot:6172381-Pleurochrysis_carterae.AAC.4
MRHGHSFCTWYCVKKTRILSAVHAPSTTLRSRGRACNAETALLKLGTCGMYFCPSFHGKVMYIASPAPADPADQIQVAFS